MEVKGIALLDDSKNLKFSGYGQKLAGCNMSFPSFDYLKSGLQGDEEAFKNYLNHGRDMTNFILMKDLMKKTENL